MANFVRWAIGPMGVTVAVAPPYLKLYATEIPNEVVARADLPRWAMKIVDGVDQNLPPRGSLDITAGEVAALLN
jgi:hypothetical protein